ncbi:MAG: PD-(D/E)XK motif protein [Microbacteriaceae bacterium]
MATEDAQKHMSPETVEDYFTIGIPTAVALSDSLRARLEIDPNREELRLICPAHGSDPDVTAYENLSFERISVLGEQGEWFVLTVDATVRHYEAYVLIESIVDQMSGGASFRHAISESLSSLKELLAGRTKLSDETQAGLIGELLLFEHVLSVESAQQTIEAWLGPMGEEHDFGFPAFDVEVKTTRAEGRVHIIGSDTQLQPSGPRPLYLLSIQITRAGLALQAFSLADLVTRLRNVLGSDRRLFDKALSRIGWHDLDADLYREKFILRSEPRAYLIDDDFPAITTQRLDLVVPHRSLLSAVSYKIDVTHRPHALPPGPINTFCEDRN